MQAAAARDDSVAARAEFYLRRSLEELYRLDLDPDALTNLADYPNHSGEIARARKQMAAWMTDVHDSLSARFATTIPARPADKL